MSDALREEVARAINRASFGQLHISEPLAMADAAIAIVLEHAAKVADAELMQAEKSQVANDPPAAVAFVSGWHGCAYRIARQIRALATPARLDAVKGEGA